MRRAVQIALALALLCGAGWAAPAVVQTCTNSGYAVTSVSCTFSSNVAAGDVVVISDTGATFAAAATASASGCGYSWVTDESDTNGFIAAHAVATAGSCTATISFSAASNDNTFILGVELSGLNGTVDAKAYSSPACNGCTTAQTPTITTTVSGDMVVAVIGPGANTSGTVTADSPFSTTVASSQGSGAIGDYVQASAGAISATFTLSGPSYYNQTNAIIAFEPSGGSGPPKPHCTIGLLGAGVCLLRQPMPDGKRRAA